MKAFKIRYLDETGSTNDDALRLMGEPESAGLVLVADFQTAGRGRKARPWVAPRGSSLLFTAILPRKLPPADLWAVQFWCALAVRAGLARETIVTPRLQWPNDVLLDGRKCAGILCVSRVQGDAAWAACGVGINVYRPNDDPDLAALPYPPAFLSDVANLNIATRDRLLVHILTALEDSLELLHDPQATAREWERQASLDGTAYSIAVDGEPGPLNAIARRLGADGALIVDVDGVERGISMADARVLR